MLLVLVSLSLLITPADAAKRQTVTDVAEIRLPDAPDQEFRFGAKKVVAELLTETVQCLRFGVQG